MNYDRGEVVLALFPDSNLRTAKRRPVLVVQVEGIGTGLPQTIVAMITSNMNRAGHPSRIVVEVASREGQQSGLRTDSVIMTDNLATLLDTEIDQSIGALSNMEAVDTALRHTLGL
ncbi:MAG: type II toxin-antitoxin system PemK/MazF family toxin [Planctomycetota bacterium]|jgi:mRNA interferase MazF|nr:type II toxin-antitoxin system PemK/MazF family toxin [Planctomycetota bacterium]MDP7133567.1 type II toxin-antitoxin system PemK/MazF family toxin [Planctomycetota bacterium]MDP7249470.1 type II toxin-antitoxin system PemK/MazF family toxin [Planctomycetota bacterium]|tara:strand:- start:93 stop:440 length:348 start_codon:yes stop_codon:yes gene_type:complete